MHEWDWQGAARELERAIELDPNNAIAHELYGYYLQAMGRASDSLVEIQRAVEIDPGWHITNNDLVLAYYYAHRFEDAINQSQKALKPDPNGSSPHWRLGYIYLEQKKYEQAIEEFELSRNPGNQYNPTGGLGCAYALTGRRAEALRAAEELKAEASQWIEMPRTVAGIYAALGENAWAMAMLEKAYEDRYPRMWQLEIDLRFDSLRSDARFKDLLRRVGMPQ